MNSSTSDESSKLQQHASLRSSLLHGTCANDTEYKYTVTVGPHSLKITGSNLDLVRVNWSRSIIVLINKNITLIIFLQAAKLALDEYFSEESEHTASGVEYFTIDEESLYEPTTPTVPHSLLSAGQTNFLKQDASFESGGSESDKKEISSPENEQKKKGNFLFNI